MMVLRSLVATSGAILEFIFQVGKSPGGFSQ
jgi:hypothetical protein